MKVIYKYPLTTHQCTLTVPHRCSILTIQCDPAGNLCMWALHDIEPDRFKKYEFLVLGTGWNIEDEFPIAEMPVQGDTNPFSYKQTVIEGDFVWHVFMREIFE